MEPSHRFDTFSPSLSAVCPSCDEFVRNVQSFAPGLAALVALISIMLFFDSVFVCKRKGKCSVSQAVLKPLRNQIVGYKEKQWEAPWPDGWCAGLRVTVSDSIPGLVIVF